MIRNLALSIILIVFMSGESVAQITTSGKGAEANLPVDIESDSLVIKPEQNMAIFKGKVKAVQGGMNLLSDQMVVFYHDDEAGGEGEMSGQLSKIEAYGNVEFSVTGKKATAENGQYDVDKSFIEMSGSVVLTQQGNILKGDKFFYNVITGESKMESATGTSTGSKNGKKRVKGVFTPKKK